jgi:hypothetical protein
LNFEGFERRVFAGVQFRLRLFFFAAFGASGFRMSRRRYLGVPAHRAAGADCDVRLPNCPSAVADFPSARVSPGLGFSHLHTVFKHRGFVLRRVLKQAASGGGPVRD